MKKDKQHPVADCNYCTKVKVNFIDTEGEALFNEEIFSWQIPPMGRKVKWHSLLRIVEDIVEDWDERKVVVTLRELSLLEIGSCPIEKNEDTINLSIYLSDRATNAIYQHLSEKLNSGLPSSSWTKQQIKSIDLNELKKMRNFGERSFKEVKQFIEKL